MKRKNSVSSKDVAREAGVSQATVSYILNNVQNVKIKPETRQAVLDAVKKLNYHPNQIARGMKLKRSMSVGVVTDRNVTNFYFMKALEGIRDGLQEDNYSITLLFNKHEDTGEAEFIKYYNSNRIDGVIFAFASVEDSQIEYLNNMGVPYVIIGTYSTERDVYEVCTDHLDYIQNVIGYFKSKGVQNIAYVGPTPKCRADRRLEAFKNAMAFHNYDLRENFIVRSTFNNNEIYKSIKGLFTDDIYKPDAIIAGSPRFGMLAVKCCHMLSIKIPNEVRIVAIGSSKYFDIIYPSISSIELPLYDMGFKAAQMFLEIIKGADVEKTAVLPSEIIERESS